MSDKIEQSLTPSAKAALDSYISELRTEILHEAKAISAGISDYPEIGVSEVFEAIRAQQGERQRDMIRARELAADKFRLVTASTASAGAILLALAITLISIRSAHSAESSSISFIAALTSAGVTLFAASFSAYYLVNTRKRYRAAERSTIRMQKRSTGEFLSEWGEFNRALNAYTAEHFGESAAGASLSKKAQFLERSGVLTPKDVTDLKKTYTIRNTLMHGGNPEAPKPEEIESAYNELRELMSRIARRETSWRASDVD